MSGGVLLMAWMALLGADRVSLLDGLTPFVVTPFLALTPLVVIAECLRRRGRGTLEISRGALGYVTLCALLLGIAFASVMVSTQPATSSARAVLLVADIAGTLAVVLLTAGRDRTGELLARGALAGLALAVCADLVALAAWTGFIPDVLHAGPVAVHLETFAYGIVPRLGGLVGDPNRAGLVFLFYGFLILRGEPRRGVRRPALVLAAALMVMTLSRSTLLATFAAAIAYGVMTRRRVPSRSLVAGAGLAVAALMVFALAVPGVMTPDFESVAPLAQRFSAAEGSAQSHVDLLRRGAAEATASIPRVLIGVGYGNAYSVLQDVFPNDRYGNFHSMYVTMFAECGVFALLLTLALIGWPVIRGGPWMPLVLGAAVFSVFYQATTEPAFWMALALAWTHSRTRPQ